MLQKQKTRNNIVYGSQFTVNDKPQTTNHKRQTTNHLRQTEYSKG